MGKIFSFSFAILIILLSGIVVKSAAFALFNWDFEDGTLQGWAVIWGDAGKQPVDNDDDRHGGNFGKQGRYFVGTYENMKDEAQVELKSPVFTISSRMLSLLVGGGAHSDQTFVALYDAHTDKELFRECGNNAENMSRRYWDVSPYIGKKVYLKIVDRHTGGWGHINVDDIRELTNDEIAEIGARRLEKERLRAKWLADLNSPTKRKVYKGRELIDIAMPLGGIGAGNIAICGDGALREWQIFNKVNASCVVPCQFFAVWAKVDDKAPVARILQTTSVEGLPEIAETEFVGEFPIAEIRYKDPSLPIKIRMEAFSPFIPMNSKDSG
ncbi:MAG: GH116 family glycosyl-hydrolase, partial [Armatimonadota bacterium]|nr:GH116 family glycosyl-hydrolase [Armatimonadota bacterium]